MDWRRGDLRAGGGLVAVRTTREPTARGSPESVCVALVVQLLLGTPSDAPADSTLQQPDVGDAGAVVVGHVGGRLYLRRRAVLAGGVGPSPGPLVLRTVAGLGHRAVQNTRSLEWFHGLGLGFGWRLPVPYPDAIYFVLELQAWGRSTPVVGVRATCMHSAQCPLR